MLIQELIEKQGNLSVVHPNMSYLFETDQAAYSLIRRTGLGASDASVYMGVNLYTKLEDLIEEKRSLVYTDKEKAIAQIENVRRGMDLEPIIINKFANYFGLDVHKPEAMYRIVAHPQLTINYDGMTAFGEMLIPVEAKYVSPYGAKYYDQARCINNMAQGIRYSVGGATIQDHIVESAKLYGIPAYYYTQIQQQMLGVDAPYAFLTVLFDKGWAYKTFKIFSDAVTQLAIITESEKLWNKIKNPS